MDELRKIFWGLSSLLLISSVTVISESCNQHNSENDQKNRVEVSVSKKRAIPGDTVIFKIACYSQKRPDGIGVYLVKPTKGVEKLSVEESNEKENEYTGKIVLKHAISEGLYGITAIVSNGNKKTVGKASFLSGKVVLDYAIMANFGDSGTVSDMKNYLDAFIKIGGNALTLHANMATEKTGGNPRSRAVWASKICKNAALAPDDRIEMMLNLTDKLGLPSFISITWDSTDSTLLNTSYMESIKDITNELWAMFGHHPSLVGFYSSQEGSGTYFANYVREFCQNVKRNNSGLLTMCAPNIDDPLLAGYLSAIDDLDIINYQAPIMTSYRPDNRKLFPNRRVKDVTSLSAGATKVRDKITLSHVELMGYIENKVANAYLTGYENIFNQFPSVASAFGPDGITFFSYFSCIYSNSKTLSFEKGRAELGVTDGLRSYNLISGEIANQSSHIALYVPYNDWCIERWTNCFMPAADALRKLGISPDIIPFIPPKGEDILPYYPMNINKEQLKFLLDHKYVLILPDISGMQETDSELLETFVRKGGTVIAFGPHIPYGDRFDRAKLWGAKEITPVQAGKIFDRINLIKCLGVRTKPGQRYSFAPIASTSWEPSTEGRIADFSDGTASLFSNNYGNGKTYVVTFSLNDAVNSFPNLVRDLLDRALELYNVERPFDVMGVNQTMDVSMNGTGKECSISLANYTNTRVQVKIKPLLLNGDTNYTLTDLKSGSMISKMSGSEYSVINTWVEGNNYVALKINKSVEK